ncbi:MAG: hypothetical protein ABI199_05790 [Bacteroidia bacterium]
MSIISTETAHFSFLNKQIIKCALRDEVEIDVKDIKKNIETLIEMTAHKKHVVLMDADMNYTITKNAWEYVATLERYENIVAFAIIASNLASRIIWKFIAKKFASFAPVQIFLDSESAVTWLNECLVEEASRGLVESESQNCLQKNNFVDIGKIIQEQFQKSELTVTEFAKKIHTTRENVYNIFRRKSMDCDLLQKISKVLNHNFFDYYQIAKSAKINKVDIQLLQKNNLILEELLERFSR